ncbi:MAG: amidohydrolase [Ilumatobacteraceae bacterium]
MPQRLLVTGRIFTADPAQPWAEALVVERGELLEVGSLDDAMAVAGDDATRLDAGDGVVLPGFVDGHAHLLAAGAAFTRAALRPCTSMAEIERELRRWMAANPDASRVLGVGWTFSALPGSTPTRQLLDAIESQRPVYLDASDLHSVWCNSAALRELGIDDSTPDPIGGTIVRDASGAATGLLLENAGYHIAWPVMNRTTPDEDDRHLAAAIDAYLAAGTTAAVDMACDRRAADAIERAIAAGRFPFTVVAHWLINRADDPADELAQVRHAAERAAAHAGERFRVAGIKLVTDGTIDGCTAGMCEPFANGEPGEMVWPRERLEPVMRLADELGLQIACHAIGDLAVRTVLDVFEVLADERAARGDRRERRHRIEHLEYVDAADIPRLAPLGVTASMQPVHVDPAYLDNWVELLGDDRARQGFAWPRYLEHGTALAFGTDVPTAAHQPLPNMYIAATRKSPTVPDAAPLRPDFALPLDAAVVHGTRESAWACFEERRRGMLRAGLDADFVVLDADPFLAGAPTLLSAGVVRTVVGGTVVAGTVVGGTVAHPA